MIATIVGALLLGFLLLVVYGTAKSAMKTDHLTKNIRERLETLEERFYNPGNYNDAFFRPTAKNKDNGKEG